MTYKYDMLLVINRGEALQTNVDSLGAGLQWAADQGFDLENATKHFYHEDGFFTQWGTGYHYLVATRRMVK